MYTSWYKMIQYHFLYLLQYVFVCPIWGIVLYHSIYIFRGTLVLRYDQSGDLLLKLPMVYSYSSFEINYSQTVLW